MARITPYTTNEYESLHQAPEVKIINGNLVKISDIVVHEFRLGDVEDPDLYAGGPLYEWQQTEAGKWIMENAVIKPFWNRMIDPLTYGWRYVIVARLKESDQIFFKLKFT
jgi:hypothetical protein